MYKEMVSPSQSLDLCKMNSADLKNFTNYTEDTNCSAQRSNLSAHGTASKVTTDLVSLYSKFERQTDISDAPNDDDFLSLEGFSRFTNSSPPPMNAYSLENYLKPVEVATSANDFWENADPDHSFWFSEKATFTSPCSSLANYNPSTLSQKLTPTAVLSKESPPASSYHQLTEMLDQDYMGMFL